jgi:CDP-glucose 4,6-dehydratase
MFKEIFRGKSVVVTGHTGFKGSWLTAWLIRLGANVTGISKDVPTIPSHFDSLKIGGRINDIRFDVRDSQRLVKEISLLKPDFVFHLAAQPIVNRSFIEPLETFETNIMGSIYILEALRNLDKNCIAIMITSDKCYDNQEWTWGYRETDRLGGKDPYSASKASAELAICAYISSYFHDEQSKIRVGIGRAGNVIGGGDWAENRIVPDCIRSWKSGETVQLRNPNATRPWQHVLEPLSGYLALAERLHNNPALCHGEAFNFGPTDLGDYNVLALIVEMQKHWVGAEFNILKGKELAPEAGLLKLNCDKARALLQWRAILDFSETVDLTMAWYISTQNLPSEDVLRITESQIARYEDIAGKRGALWAH